MRREGGLLGGVIRHHMVCWCEAQAMGSQNIHCMRCSVFVLHDATAGKLAAEGRHLPVAVLLAIWQDLPTCVS